MKTFSFDVNKPNVVNLHRTVQVQQDQVREVSSKNHKILIAELVKRIAVLENQKEELELELGEIERLEKERDAKIAEEKTKKETEIKADTNNQPKQEK